MNNAGLASRPIWNFFKNSNQAASVNLKIIQYNYELTGYVLLILVFIVHSSFMYVTDNAIFIFYH